MTSAVIGVVDDDAGTLFTVRAMLEALGRDVKTTESPEEAVGWVKDGLVDILLIDYHMPVMSGLDVIRQARRLSGSVVLLALTADESPEIAHELLTAGADDYILKPLRFADFSSRIALHAELMRYRQYERAAGIQKGLSENTARLVYSQFSEGASLTASEAAEKSGLAYQTAYRYLEYLVKKGRLSRRAQSEDGKSGRPKIVYSRPAESRRAN